MSTALGTGLLVAAAGTDDTTQAVLRVVALGVDIGGPLLSGADGWKLAPEHFAERHGLILIIALGESLVAIGAGVVPGDTGGLGGDVVAARRLEHAASGRERNEIARDSSSLLQLPMVAGIVLVALGLKKTLADVDGELATVPAAALLGGTARYLLAHVAFRLRNVRRLPVLRLVVAALLLAVVPVAGVTGLLAALVAFEAVRFAPLRAELLSLRHEGEPVSAPPPSSPRR